MQWVQYFRNIVTRYSVVVEGWPEHIPFANLSGASSALPQLEQLLRQWELGTTFWKRITEADLTQMRSEREARITSGELVEPARRPRSDKGGQHKRSGAQGTPAGETRAGGNTVVNTTSMTTLFFLSFQLILYHYSIKQ